MLIDSPGHGRRDHGGIVSVLSVKGGPDDRAHVKAVAKKLAKAVAAGDRKADISVKAERERLALKARPLESLKPTLPRTAESFRRVMREIVELGK